MYERLSDKNNMPTIEDFILHIGLCKELFENIDLFITNELNAEKELGFSSDKNVRGWGVGFKSKSKFFGTIIAEKDAFTVVMRLTDEQIKKAHDEVLPYAQECLNNYQRTSNGGWVQYRVLNTEQLEDVKKILRIRNK
jgi:hypothetical protein